MKDTRPITTKAYQVMMFILAAAVMLSASHTASAVPAFARQVNTACSSCHFQDFPALNAFGRAFKQQGYTLQVDQDNVENGNISLPRVLNSSLITKIRYQKTNGDNAETDTGELQFPDEAALLIGGRAAEDIGFLLELATFGAANTGTGEVSGSGPGATADTGTGDFSLFGSFKVHFNRQINGTNVGAVLFSTESGGASYGYELLNTGAQRMIRAAEDRTSISAQQFVGLGAGEAEGLSLVAANDKGFGNVTFWTPDHGNTAVESFAHYVRGALTPTINGWDTGFGFQYFGGTAERSIDSEGDIDTEGWALDAQAQGDLNGKPLGIYATYAVADASPNNQFNRGVGDKEAWALLGELGVMPGQLMVQLAFLDGDDGSDPALQANEDQRVMLGATWMLRENIELHAWHTSYSGNKYDPTPADGGDSLTSLMLFAGF